MKNFSITLIVFCLIAFAAGCSKLKEENPAASENRVGVHPAGFPDPASPNFHGKVIAARNYDMRECTHCHGADYKGSGNATPCTQCHTKPGGPENCTTCHGSVNPAPPPDLAGNTSPTSHAVGQHQIHVSGGLGASMRCSTCHHVPQGIYDPAHFDGVPGAEIIWDTASVARTVTNEPGAIFYSAALPTVTPNPVYTQSAGSCAGTYCHGNFKNGNPTNTVVWNDTSASAAACGTCHGDVTKPTIQLKAMPKTVNNGGVHPTATQCEICHFGIIDANGTLLDPTKHVNGKVDVYGQSQNY